MSAPVDAPTSPELVLVAPPDEAELARRTLPMPERHRPPVALEFPPPRVRARATHARRAAAGGAAVAVLAALAIAVWVVVRHWSGEPPTASGQAQRTPSSTAAPTHRSQPVALPKPKPKPQAKPKPKPATTTHTQTSSKPKPAKAPTTAPFVPSRVFAWPPEAGAKAYVVRFFRGTKLVLERRVEATKITLPTTFRFTPGHYRWNVTGVDAAGREGTPLLESRFDVGARP